MQTECCADVAAAAGSGLGEDGLADVGGKIKGNILAANCS